MPARERPQTDWTPLLALTGVVFVIRAAASWTDGYGWFIDELYYVSCARRPALGYVDHPPLSIWLIELVTVRGAESLFVLRLIAALFGSACAVLSGWLAAQLGGGRFGQALATVCVLAMPGGQAIFGFYSMNAIEVLLWGACLAVAVLLLQTGQPRWWLGFGLVAGVGLLDKHTIVLLGAAVIVGFALTGAGRRTLASRWLWIGGGVALLCLLPNLAWQVAHGWPSLDFYVAQDSKNIPTGPLEVLAAQVLLTNPLALPIWLAGVIWLIRSPSLRPLGLVWPLLVGFLIAMQLSRPDRVFGVYILLFAAGSVAVEARLSSIAARVGLMLAVVLTGSALAPIGIPILSPETMARYVAAIGVVPKIEAGEGKTSELPQWYADRFGWPEQVEVLERVVADLSADEQAHAVILAPSYGHAGAVEILGRDLPPVVSPHLSWARWSDEILRELEVDVVVAMSFGPDELGRAFAEVEQVATLRCDQCPRWRRDMPVYVARRPRGEPLRDLLAAWVDE
jgi:4-amino-4-deoxy-L-arabinose transferase-like glycosyltransferase